MTMCHMCMEVFFVIKKTFYNLPQEKRQRIINAVMQEFSGSSPEKVSINRIIKTADISRGSFYQYFDDKVDLVEILTEVFIKKSFEKARTALKESNGDMFFTYEKIFDIITELGNDKKQKAVLKNIFKNIKANDDLVSEYFMNRFTGFSEYDDIIKYFNRDNLKFKDDYSVSCLYKILAQILKSAIFDLYVLGIDCNKVKECYLRKIEIIKAGALTVYIS